MTYTRKPMRRERQKAQKRDNPGWVDARLFVPDDHRKVIVLVYNKAHFLSPQEARFSGGEWRFVNEKHKEPRSGKRVRAWMDVPWYDTRGRDPDLSTSCPEGARPLKLLERALMGRRRLPERPVLIGAEAEFD